MPSSLDKGKQDQGRFQRPRQKKKARATVHLDERENGLSFLSLGGKGRQPAWPVRREVIREHEKIARRKRPSGEKNCAGLREEKIEVLQETW